MEEGEAGLRVGAGVTLATLLSWLTARQPSTRPATNYLCTELAAVLGKLATEQVVIPVAYVAEVI